MRLSVNPNDPGYDLEKGVRATIYLDGKEQKFVTTADEDEGIVERFMLDESGKPYLAGDEIAAEVVSGKVEIVLREGES